MTYWRLLIIVRTGANIKILARFCRESCECPYHAFPAPADVCGSWGLLLACHELLSEGREGEPPVRAISDPERPAVG